MSPPRSTQAPPAGQPSGGVEDPITLTALSSIVSTLMQKQDVDLDALRALANAAVTINSNIPPCGTSNTPAASTSVPTVVPTGASSIRTSSPSVPVDVPPSVALVGVS
nr:hypothetical protein [Tanacetum cinerariifolium]